ncbi:MAG: PilZ domain-containing protein [Azoarcus sp.]|jgi:hypothetical protein|nr:PilZ domain-containing protein [Azoarcus sp.]
MDHAAPRDRRLDRRIPVGCPACIRPNEGEEITAECTELSVSGMTLRASYVPIEGEVVEVVIASPNDSMDRPPLVKRLRIIRCHALDSGQYEIGGSIVH